MTKSAVLLHIIAFLTIMPSFASTAVKESRPEFGLFRKRTNKERPLPESVHWPHRPVYVQAGEDMELLGMAKDQPIPLGVPFDFETHLFKGQILLRFRNAKSDDEESHKDYFQGRKRLMQTVLQGRFKRPMKMSEVYAGSIFEKPLAGAPPPTMTKIMDAVIRRIAPGLVLDLASAKPKVIALLAGTAQSMSIDAPGSQPDISLPMIPENVASTLGHKLATASKRRKHLGIPKKAEKFEFDTDHIYTFHSYDDAMDYGRGSMQIPMYGELDIKSHIGEQPLSLTAVTNKGDTLYDLKIWHEASLKAATQSQSEWSENTVVFQL